MDFTLKDHITKKNIRKKNRTDKISKAFFLICSILSASFILMIIFFVVSKGATPFFSHAYKTTDGLTNLDPVNFFRFITKDMWLEGSVGYSSDYGIGFAIINTFIVVFGALIIAIPISVLTALFIARIASKKFGDVVRTVVELLASIPSIIYGVFGLGVVAKIVSVMADLIGLKTSAGLSLLTTSIVLAIMVMPTITAVSETAIRSVKQDIINGSLALGATEIQTHFKVVLTSAKSGIFAGVILGVGRALGEATAVSMVSGNLFSGINLNPFGTTTTLTSRMLLGFKETIGLDYDIRFSVGVVLLAVIIITNFILRRIFLKVGNLDD